MASASWRSRTSWTEQGRPRQWLRVAMVMPWFVAPPGSCGASTKPPSIDGPQTMAAQRWNLALASSMALLVHQLVDLVLDSRQPLRLVVGVGLDLGQAVIVRPDDLLERVDAGPIVHCLAVDAKACPQAAHHDRGGHDPVGDLVIPADRSVGLDFAHSPCPNRCNSPFMPGAAPGA